MEVVVVFKSRAEVAFDPCRTRNRSREPFRIMAEGSLEFREHFGRMRAAFDAFYFRLDLSAVDFNVIDLAQRCFETLVPFHQLPDRLAGQHLFKRWFLAGAMFIIDALDGSAIGAQRKKFSVGRGACRGVGTRTEGENERCESVD
jgi:hypothetical protein